MKKIIVYTVLFALCPLLLFAQAPDTLWTKAYGGSLDDIGRSVKQTIDGGYIIGGYTQSFGNGGYDIYLIKIDSVGDTLWTKTYGGTGHDYCSSVDQTSDGGYILAGSTRSYGAGSADFYLIKTSSSGDTIWTKTYGGADLEHAYDVYQTSDEGYILAGYTDTWGTYDIYLIKTDSTGDTLWTRTYGDAGEDQMARSIKQTNDGGYIIADRSGWQNYSSFGIFKIDMYGDSIWQYYFWGEDRQEPYSVQITQDGGYIAAGFQWIPVGPSGHTDCHVIKIDSNGTCEWRKNIGAADNNECAYAIWSTIDGGYIIAGPNAMVESDFYIIKIDGLGDTLWTKTIGGAEDDIAYAVQQTADGGYIVCGKSNSFGAGLADVYLIKIAPETGVEEEKIIRSGIGQKIFSPNIFSGPLLLPEGESYRVFDITGRAVVPDHIKPGIYFIEVDRKITQKVIKIR